MPNRNERRRRAKQAATQGHTVNTPPIQPPVLQAQKSLFPSLWFSSVWGMFWSGVVAFGTILGIISGAYFFAPQLSATPSTTMIESDPMSTFFLIANEGNLDLHDVSFSCRVNTATDGRGIYIAMSENNISTFRANFQAKGKIGLPCLAATHLERLAQADISIIIQFRPSFWPYRKKSEYRFRTQQGDHEKVYWLPEVAPFVFDPSKIPN